MANVLSEAVKIAKLDLRVLMGKHIRPEDLTRLFRILDRIGALETIDSTEAAQLTKLLSSDFQRIHDRMRGPYKNGPNAVYAGHLVRIGGEFFRAYIDNRTTEN